MFSYVSPRFVSVYIVRIDSEGPKYLFLRRSGDYLPGTWQPVTGGIENTETPEEAALREVFEETGLIPDRLYSADAVETFYMQSIGKIAFVPVFVAFVTENRVRLSPTEHDAYEWLAYEEALKKPVWSEQKRILSHIRENFLFREPHTLLAINSDNTTSLPKCFSRTGVYGISEQENQILFVKQQKGPHKGKWDFPGGGIEPGEEIEEALRREIREETGMTFDSMQPCINIAVTTKDEEQGRIFHQIALLYTISEVRSPEDIDPELQWRRISRDNFSKTSFSPLVIRFLQEETELQKR